MMIRGGGDGDEIGCLKGDLERVGEWANHVGWLARIPSRYGLGL